MSRKILGIVGSYRENGVIDTVVSSVLDAAASTGADTRKIYLKDQDVRFCTNCRECVQTLGPEYQPCLVHDDDMQGIVGDILAADSIVIGAPVNIGSVTGVTQRFIERCVGFYYYPWGQHFPVPRDKKLRRRAVLISSSAAPAFMNRQLFGCGAMGSLRQFASIVRADVVREIKVGMVNSADFEVPAAILKTARQTGERLAA